MKKILFILQMIICNYIDYKTLNNSSQKISTNNNNIYYSTKNNFLIYTTNIDISNSPLTDYFKINVFKENNLYYQIPIRYDNCISNTSNNYPLVIIDDNNYFVTKIATLGSFSSTETNTNFPCGIVNIDFYIISLKEDGYEIVNSWNNLKFLGEKANNYCLNCDYYKIISLIYSEKIERYVGFFMLTKITNTDLKIFLIVTMNENQNELIENIYIYNLNLTNVKDINKIDGTNYIYFIYPDENKILILDLEKNYLSDNPGVFIKLNINLNSIPTEVIYNSEYDVFLISNKLLDKIFIHIFKLNKDRTGILNEYGIYDIIIPDNISGNRVTSLLFTYPFLTTCIINQCIVFKLPNFPKLDSFSIYDIYSINNQSNNQINTTITKLYPVYNNFTINLYIAGYYYSQSYVTSFIGKINDCIFLNSEISNRCSTECLTGEYNKDKTCTYTFSNCNKIINNGQCIDYCNNKLLKYQSLSYCLDKCPIGYYDYNNNCISVCPDNTFIYNYRCYDKCPDYTFIYNNICLDTCNLVDENTNPLTCLDICEKYILIRPQYSSCVDSCPVGYTIKDNKCIECRDCNTCPLYNQIIQDNNRINCLYCKTINKYYFNGKCIDYIPSIPYINLLDQNAILHCYELNKYISNNKCVSECPPDEYPNRQYKCVNKNQGYLYLGYIVDKCPIGYGITDDKKCENCIDRYIFNNKCITQCPELYYQSDNNQCVHCSIFKKTIAYLEKCTKCSDGYINENYECSLCPQDQFLINNSFCSSSCNYKSKIDFNSRKCIPCEENEYIYNNQCFEKCPDSTIPDDSTFICYGNFKCDNMITVCKCTNNMVGENCELTKQYLFNFNKIIFESFNNTKVINSKFIDDLYKNITFSYKSDKIHYLLRKEEIINSILNISNIFYYDNLKRESHFTDSIYKLIDFSINNLEIKFNSSQFRFFVDLIDNITSYNIQTKAEILPLFKKFTWMKFSYYNLDDISALRVAEDMNNTIVELSNNCTQKIRNLLGKPYAPLYIKNIEFTRNFKNDSQNSIEYYIYSEDGTKLNIEKECLGISSKVKLPLNLQQSDILNYQNFKSKGYDIFDIKGPFYDMCSAVVDDDENIDITFSERIKDLTNKYVNCGDDCSYNGFDGIKYIICKCLKVNITIVSVFKNMKDEIMRNNFFLFKCYEHVIGEKKNWENFGYYLTLIVFIITVLLLIIFHIIDKFRKDKYNSIFKQDSQIYHPSMLILNEYILYLTERYEFLRSKKKFFYKKNGQIEECSDSIKLAEINNNKDIEKIINKECNPNFEIEEKHVSEDVDSKDGDYNEKAFPSINFENSENINIIKRRENNQIFKDKFKSRLTKSLFNANIINRHILQLKRTRTAKSILIGKQSSDLSKNIISIEEKEMENCINYKMSYTEITYMNIREKLEFDKRNIFRFLLDLILRKHVLIDTFYVVSVINPRFMKIIFFFLQISVQFMLNAIFYSDDIIGGRKFRPQITTRDKIVYEIETFPRKILPSIIFAVGINIILKIILMTPSTSTKKLLNERIISRKEEVINMAIQEYNQRMLIRYIIFTLVSLLLFLISYYYLIAFLAVYPKSAENCILSGLFTLLISSTIAPLYIPILHSISRLLAKIWPNKVLIFIYFIFNKFL